VTVTSNADRRVRVDFDRVEPERDHHPGRAYERSELANLIFAYELQRRLRAARVETISLAAHPADARTGLWRTSSRLERALLARRLRPLTFSLTQNARDGARPTLRAAVDPDARGGDCYGPAGRLEYTGRPMRVESSAASLDRSVQGRLWRLSERLTSVRYRLDDGGSR
jgi:hypothetical protein